MFLTVHGAIGIIIGQHVRNPIWAFIVGLISHYLFDLIPHGDTNAPVKWKNPIHVGFAALIDIFILIVFLLLLETRVQLINLATAGAFLGAVIPDFLQGFYFISNKKILKKHQSWHDFFHFLIAGKFEWKFYQGIAFQIIIFIILITLIT